MSATGKGGNRVSNGQDTFPRDGLPSRPMTLTDAETKVWTSLMSQIPNELLRRIDAVQLTTLCELIVEKDELGKLMKEQRGNLPLVRTYINTAQQINRSSAMFGLSPIDRRRMKLEQVDEQDDIADWENED
jgi:phage terminase small subunit